MHSIEWPASDSGYTLHTHDQVLEGRDLIRSELLTCDPTQPSQSCYPVDLVPYMVEGSAPGSPISDSGQVVHTRPVTKQYNLVLAKEH